MRFNAGNLVYNLSLKEFSPIKVLVKNMHKISHIEIPTLALKEYMYVVL